MKTTTWREACQYGYDPEWWRRPFPRDITSPVPPQQAGNSGKPAKPAPPAQESPK